MKRLILCLLLALCFTACAAQQERTTTAPQTAEPVTAQPTDTAQPSTEEPQSADTAQPTEEETQPVTETPAADQSPATEAPTLAEGEVPDEELEPRPLTETPSEAPTLAPGEVPDEELESQPLSGISADEYDNFGVTVPDVGNTIKSFRPFEETMQSSFLGTWYDPSLGEALRITEDGAYVYIPYLDLYGDTLYRWELVDRSDSGKCPKLAIYCFEGGPLAYYVAGNTGDYFWCISQGQLFYKQ